MSEHSRERGLLPRRDRREEVRPPSADQAATAPSVPLEDLAEEAGLTRTHSATKLPAVLFLLLATLTVSVAPANGAYWKRIWGPVKLFLANDSGQYAVKLPEEDIYERREDHPVGEPEWVRIGGPGREFAVTDDKLYGLTPDGGAIYEYSGTPGQWILVGGAAGHIYAGPGGLFATNPTTGELWAYELTVWEGGACRVRPGWTKVGGAGAMFSVGRLLTPSGCYPLLYGLSPNRDSVWQYATTPMSWTQIGGPANRIWAFNLHYVLATSPATGELYKYNDGAWQGLGGAGLEFAVGQCDIYGLSSDYKVWKPGDAPYLPWVRIDGWIGSQPQNLKFDRIFDSLHCLTPKVREKGTKALWSLEWDEPEPPHRDPGNRGR